MMDSGNLTSEQLGTIKEQLTAGRTYLRRLENRMRSQGFPGDDQLLKLTTDAHDAIDRLWVHVHYAECDAFTREYAARKSVGAGTCSPPAEA